MDILAQLSSQTGDRSEGANRKVVAQCLENQDLINEIVQGLHCKDAALVGDCAEVLTLVAATHPQWVAPYAGALVESLAHRVTRIRWEAMHALALVAEFAPETIVGQLQTLAAIIRMDSSIIVRDYAVDVIGNFASIGAPPAEQAYPLLMEALTVWEGRHAGHALSGLVNVAKNLPSRQAELGVIARKYMQDRRGVIRKAAKALLSVTS